MRQRDVDGVRTVQVGANPALGGTYLAGSSMRKRGVQLLCWLQLMAAGLAQMIGLTLCECCKLVAWMLTMQRHRFVAVSVWARGRDGLRRSGRLPRKAGERGRGDSTDREPAEAVTRVVSLRVFPDFPNSWLLLCNLPGGLLSNRGSSPQPRCTTTSLKDSAAYRDLGASVALID